MSSLRPATQVVLCSSPPTSVVHNTTNNSNPNNNQTMKMSSPFASVAAATATTPTTGAAATNNDDDASSPPILPVATGIHWPFQQHHQHHLLSPDSFTPREWIRQAHAAGAATIQIPTSTTHLDSQTKTFLWLAADNRVLVWDPVRNVATELCESTEFVKAMTVVSILPLMTSGSGGPTRPITSSSSSPPVLLALVGTVSGIDCVRFVPKSVVGGGGTGTSSYDTDEGAAEKEEKNEKILSIPCGPVSNMFPILEHVSDEEQATAVVVVVLENGGSVGLLTITSAVTAAAEANTQGVVGVESTSSSSASSFTAEFEFADTQVDISGRAPTAAAGGAFSNISSLFFGGGGENNQKQNKMIVSTINNKNDHQVGSSSSLFGGKFFQNLTICGGGGGKKNTATANPVTSPSSTTTATTAAALSPDGSILCTADSDSTISIWYIQHQHQKGKGKGKRRKKYGGAVSLHLAARLENFLLQSATATTTTARNSGGEQAEVVDRGNNDRRAEQQRNGRKSTTAPTAASTITGFLWNTSSTTKGDDVDHHDLGGLVVVDVVLSTGERHTLDISQAVDRVVSHLQAAEVVDCLSSSTAKEEQQQQHKRRRSSTSFSSSATASGNSSPSSGRGVYVVGCDAGTAVILHKGQKQGGQQRQGGRQPQPNVFSSLIASSASASPSNSLGSGSSTASGGGHRICQIESLTGMNRHGGGGGGGGVGGQGGRDVVYLCRESNTAYISTRRYQDQATKLVSEGGGCGGRGAGSEECEGGGEVELVVPFFSSGSSSTSSSVGHHQAGGAGGGAGAGAVVGDNGVGGAGGGGRLLGATVVSPSLLSTGGGAGAGAGAGAGVGATAGYQPLYVYLLYSDSVSQIAILPPSIEWHRKIQHIHSGGTATSSMSLFKKNRKASILYKAVACRSILQRHNKSKRSNTSSTSVEGDPTWVSFLESVLALNNTNNISVSSASEVFAERQNRVCEMLDNLTLPTAIVSRRHRYGGHIDANETSLIYMSPAVNAAVESLRKALLLPSVDWFTVNMMDECTLMWNLSIQDVFFPSHSGSISRSRSSGFLSQVDELASDVERDVTSFFKTRGWMDVDNAPPLTHQIESLLNWHYVTTNNTSDGIVTTSSEHQAQHPGCSAASASADQTLSDFFSSYSSSSSSPSSSPSMMSLVAKLPSPSSSGGVPVLSQTQALQLQAIILEKIITASRRLRLLIALAQVFQDFDISMGPAMSSIANISVAGAVFQPGCVEQCATTACRVLFQHSLRAVKAAQRSLIPRLGSRPYLILEAEIYTHVWNGDITAAERLLEQNAFVLFQIGSLETIATFLLLESREKQKQKLQEQQQSSSTHDVEGDHALLNEVLLAPSSSSSGSDESSGSGLWLMLRLRVAVLCQSPPPAPVAASADALLLDTRLLNLVIAELVRLINDIRRLMLDYRRKKKNNAKNDNQNNDDNNIYLFRLLSLLRLRTQEQAAEATTDSSSSSANLEFQMSATVEEDFEVDSEEDHIIGIHDDDEGNQQAQPQPLPKEAAGVLRAAFLYVFANAPRHAVVAHQTALLNWLIALEHERDFTVVPPIFAAALLSINSTPSPSTGTHLATHAATTTATQMVEQFLFVHQHHGDGDEDNHHQVQQQPQQMMQMMQQTTTTTTTTTTRSMRLSLCTAFFYRASMRLVEAVETFARLATATATAETETETECQLTSSTSTSTSCRSLEQRLKCIDIAIRLMQSPPYRKCLRIYSRLHSQQQQQQQQQQHLHLHLHQHQQAPHPLQRQLSQQMQLPISQYQQQQQNQTQQQSALLDITSFVFTSLQSLLAAEHHLRLQERLRSAVGRHIAFCNECRTQGQGGQALLLPPTLIGDADAEDTDLLYNGADGVDGYDAASDASDAATSTVLVAARLMREEQRRRAELRLQLALEAHATLSQTFVPRRRHRHHIDNNNQTESAEEEQEDGDGEERGGNRIDDDDDANDCLAPLFDMHEILSFCAADSDAALIRVELLLLEICDVTTRAAVLARQQPTSSKLSPPFSSSSSHSSFYNAAQHQHHLPYSYSGSGFNGGLAALPGSGSGSYYGSGLGGGVSGGFGGGAVASNKAGTDIYFDENEHNLRIFDAIDAALFPKLSDTTTTSHSNSAEQQLGGSQGQQQNKTVRVFNYTPFEEGDDDDEEESDDGDGEAGAGGVFSTSSSLSTTTASSARTPDILNQTASMHTLTQQQQQQRIPIIPTGGVVTTTTTATQQRGDLHRERQIRDQLTAIPITQTGQYEKLSVVKELLRIPHRVTQSYHYSSSGVNVNGGGIGGIGVMGMTPTAPVETAMLTTNRVLHTSVLTYIVSYLECLTRVTQEARLRCLRESGSLSDLRIFQAYTSLTDVPLRVATSPCFEPHAAAILKELAMFVSVIVEEIWSGRMSTGLGGGRGKNNLRSNRTWCGDVEHDEDGDGYGDDDGSDDEGGMSSFEPSSVVLHQYHHHHMISKGSGSSSSSRSGGAGAGFLSGSAAAASGMLGDANDDADAEDDDEEEVESRAAAAAAAEALTAADDQDQKEEAARDFLTVVETRVNQLEAHHANNNILSESDLRLLQETKAVLQDAQDRLNSNDGSITKTMSWTGF